MLKAHPRGLRTIFLTELWERVGFYTVLAVLTLFMDKTLRWSDGAKGQAYGLFLATCYFVPLLGGWLGDRVLGPIRTVQVGGVLMALGYACLTLSGPGTPLRFVSGLGLIGIGTGLFKVNMSVLVGQLYDDRPALKDAGYNLFYMGVNVGGMLAPLLATVVGVLTQDYRLCFAISGAGMLLALATFAVGRKHLPGGTHATDRTAQTALPPMPLAEIRDRTLTLVVLFLIVVVFWVAYFQNGFAMTLFAERSVRAYRWLRPETYQFFEPFYILVLTPLLLAFWGRWARRGQEPSTPVKILVGMGIMGLAMAVMALAARLGGNLDQPIMSPGWLIGVYFVVTVAELLISPMGQSYVSKVAPPHLQGLMMGGWFAAVALGSYGSGFMGRHYGAFPHDRYFLVLTGLLALSGVLVAVFLPRLRRYGG